MEVEELENPDEEYEERVMVLSLDVNRKMNCFLEL